MIFVFGSNEAGRHGAGAALDALREHGAIYGQGFGRQRNSFAIPTKDRNLKPLPLSRIKEYVMEFRKYARANDTSRRSLIALNANCQNTNMGIIGGGTNTKRRTTQRAMTTCDRPHWLCTGNRRGGVYSIPFRDRCIK
jgi:hypothetical protein